MKILRWIDTTVRSREKGHLYLTGEDTILLERIINLREREGRESTPVNKEPQTCDGGVMG